MIWSLKIAPLSYFPSAGLHDHIWAMGSSREQSWEKKPTETNTRHSWALWVFLTKACSGINREEVHFLCGHNLTDKIQTKFLTSFACNRNKITFLWSSFLSPQNCSLTIWAKRIRALMCTVYVRLQRLSLSNFSPYANTSSIVLNRSELRVSYLSRFCLSAWAGPLRAIAKGLKIMSKYCSLKCENCLWWRNRSFAPKCNHHIRLRISCHSYIGVEYKMQMLTWNTKVKEL